ncbi:MAG: antibiotic biosynthesis monooxygenase [Thaumarchaeota archaeon]|nr:MAG: antibiotic biosynthesis monooxygenase [Nitrososphaerota archaeon]
MFLVIIDINFKKELESDFKIWFSKSHNILSKFEGLVSRRLVNSTGDKHSIIVEHQSRETFDKMYQSEEYTRLQSEAASSFKVKPLKPSVYNLV